MEENMLATGEDYSPSPLLLNPHAQTKGGDDPIFHWFSRSMAAKAEGFDVVNGTLGSLLHEDGTLMVNKTVEAHIRQQPERELCGYAPLKGLPPFRELAIEMALGDQRVPLEKLGLSAISIATPGGCGALSVSATNFIDRGDNLLLRNRHWSPYQTIIHEQNCGIETWPLIPESPVNGLENYDGHGFTSALTGLVERQKRILIWLNDPAHNPTGLSLCRNERSALLNDIWGFAVAHPSTGFTLLIDAAYSLYANEPFGWAESILEKMKSERKWPTNLMLCFAVSCSKSHTVYGLRTGALVCLHPDKKFLNNVSDVLLHSGRGTWSAAPRVAQRAISEIHNDAQLLEKWTVERDAFKQLLAARREALRSSAITNGLTINPTHDGYFAFLECEENHAICEMAAKDHQVYLVPLKGGIRIGVCAIPEEKMERVAVALADGLARTR
jgi:aromatic-amino-acid transaminase